MTMDDPTGAPDPITWQEQIIVERGGRIHMTSQAIEQMNRAIADAMHILHLPEGVLWQVVCAQGHGLDRSEGLAFKAGQMCPTCRAEFFAGDAEGPVGPRYQEWLAQRGNPAWHPEFRLQRAPYNFTDVRHLFTLSQAWKAADCDRRIEIEDPALDLGGLAARAFLVDDNARHPGIGEDWAAALYNAFGHLADFLLAEDGDLDG